MLLNELFQIYNPYIINAYDDKKTILGIQDNTGDQFMILVKVRENVYINLTNYEDPGIASNEFYIDDEYLPDYKFTYINDEIQIGNVCAKAIQWAVFMKQTLKTTDDYHITIEPARHPFLRSIYENYFNDLNQAIYVLANTIYMIPSYADANTN
jgi:hypothetical protein